MSRMTASAEADDIRAASRPALGLAARQLWIRERTIRSNVAKHRCM